MAKQEEAPKRVSRRQFVKGAAVGGAGVAAAGMLASCAPAPVPTTAPGETAAPAPTCPPAAECPPAGECPPAATPWIPATWDEEADVVVVGYGAAGMPAAIDANDAGAKVIIIEKCDWTGGSYRRSGGWIVGAGTKVQAALGVEDSPDLYYQYLVKCSEDGYWTDPALQRVVADTCGANVDWIIEDLGGVFPVQRVPPEWDYKSSMTEGYPFGLAIDSSLKDYAEELEKPRIARSHVFPGIPGEAMVKDSPYTGGQGLFKPFDDAIKAREITTMLQTPILGLVVGPDREVLGVKALSGGEAIKELRPMSVTGTGMVEVEATVGYRGGNEIYIKAKKGVVLATGSYTWNDEMVKNFNPSEIPVDKRADVIHHPEQQDGAGIIAGHSVGAALLDMGVNSDLGGLKINTKAQVIDVYGEVIPRLYAAPFAAAGSYPALSPGSGHHHAHSVCFGRIAGQNAAAETAWE